MHRIGLLLLAIGGLAAAAVALYGYFMPLTGINETVGPLLAALGGGSLVLGAVILAGIDRGGLRIALIVLLVIAAVLTALAGWFLLHLSIVVAALIALLGTLMAAFANPYPEAAS